MVTHTGITPTWKRSFILGIRFLTICSGSFLYEPLFLMSAVMFKAVVKSPYIRPVKLNCLAFRNSMSSIKFLVSSRNSRTKLTLSDEDKVGVAVILASALW